MSWVISVVMNQTPATPPICWNLVISAHHAHSAKYLCAEHKHVVPELPSVYMVIEEVAEVKSPAVAAVQVIWMCPPFPDLVTGVMHVTRSLW